MAKFAKCGKGYVHECTRSNAYQMHIEITSSADMASASHFFLYNIQNSDGLQLHHTDPQIKQVLITQTHLLLMSCDLPFMSCDLCCESRD